MKLVDEDWSLLKEAVLVGSRGSFHPRDKIYIFSFYVAPELHVIEANERRGERKMKLFAVQHHEMYGLHRLHIHVELERCLVHGRVSFRAVKSEGGGKLVYGLTTNRDGADQKEDKSKSGNEIGSGGHWRTLGALAHLIASATCFEKADDAASGGTS